MLRYFELMSVVSIWTGCQVDAICNCAWSRLFAGIRYAPDAARTIVGDIERAVVAYGYSYGPAPDLSICGYKSGEEIFVLASGFAVLHGNANSLVASAIGAVPGAVFGCESIAVVFRWEVGFGGGVKGHSERGHVGLNQDVGSDDLGLELGMSAHEPGVLMATHVI